VKGGIVKIKESLMIKKAERKKKSNFKYGIIEIYTNFDAFGKI
jgi:hypothetical protein